jgi:hypothetical protein
MTTHKIVYCEIKKMMQNRLYFENFFMFREIENKWNFILYHFAKQSSIQNFVSYRSV